MDTAAGEAAVSARPLFILELLIATLLLVQHVEGALSQWTLVVEAPVLYFRSLLLLR